LRFLDGSLTCFVIFGITVHLPEIVKPGIGQNIFRAQHRGHHGMILIVVFVHAVAAHEMEVRVTLLDFVANRRHVLRVIVIVNRVGFFLPDNAAVEDIAFLR
jgi:hypothetical protein